MLSGLDTKNIDSSEGEVKERQLQTTPNQHPAISSGIFPYLIIEFYGNQNNNKKVDATV